jgi:hypothetical protein
MIAIIALIVNMELGVSKGYEIAFSVERYQAKYTPLIQ